MNMKLTCPSCNAGLNIPEQLYGKKGKCPKCSCIIEIPTKPPEDIPELSLFESESPDPPPQPTFNSQDSVCAYCGNQIEANKVFCPKCGHMIENVTESLIPDQTGEQAVQDKNLITIICPSCKAILEFADKEQNYLGTCPDCKYSFIVNCSKSLPIENETHEKTTENTSKQSFNYENIFRPSVFISNILPRLKSVKVETVIQLAVVFVIVIGLVSVFIINARDKDDLKQKPELTKIDTINQENQNGLPALSEGVVMQNVKAEVTDGKATFTGVTNLPEETILVSELRMIQGGQYIGQADGAVSNGTFEFGPYSTQSGPLPIGKYKFSINVTYAHTQPESVKAIIGDMGENLHGPLVVERDDVWGASVEFSAMFVIDKSGDFSTILTQKEDNTGISSEEHLKAAKKALADGYSPNADPAKTKWGKVDEAREQLSAIKEASPDYPEAQELMKEVTRREVEMGNVIIREAEKKTAIKKREQAAKFFENSMLSKGYDIYVSVGDEDKTTLHLTYVLFSRPLVYQIINNQDVIDSFKSLGFKKITFSDKYEQKWEYDIK